MNSAYAYVYDDFLADRKYERDVAAFESTLNSYGISGHVGRCTLFRNARDLVEDLVKRGASTVVVVGNDQTLDKVMWFLPDLNVTVGYVPFDPASRVAALLQIPQKVEACNALSVRFTETFDMGKIEDRYFLTEVSVSHTLASVEVEGRYRVSPESGGSIHVRNLGGILRGEISIADGQDGFLETVIVPEDGKSGGLFRRKNVDVKETRIFLKNGRLLSKEPMEAVVDSHAVSGFSFSLRIEPNKLKFITGRTRRIQHADTPAAAATFIRGSGIHRFS